MTTEYYSRTSFGANMLCEDKVCIGTAKNISNTFTPEDIELTETLYCLWNAE